SILFHGTALLLWFQHRHVFRAAGRSFPRFWTDSRRAFARLQSCIRKVALSGARADVAGEDRMD
ncbi:MAG TPA: hypothetical protein VL285_07675, partial [Bryobacteraceae bacterium]|nr:hypothetical protein [Bryobacteraceae bacterium]